MAGNKIAVVLGLNQSKPLPPPALHSTRKRCASSARLGSARRELSAPHHPRSASHGHGLFTEDGAPMETRARVIEILKGAGWLLLGVPLFIFLGCGGQKTATTPTTTTASPSPLVLASLDNAPTASGSPRYLRVKLTINRV